MAREERDRSMRLMCVCERTCRWWLYEDSAAESIDGHEQPVTCAIPIDTTHACFKVLPTRAETYSMKHPATAARDPVTGNLLHVSDVYTHIRTRTHARAHAHTHARARAHTHTHARTHAHTHTHTHTHTQTRRRHQVTAYIGAAPRSRCRCI